MIDKCQFLKKLGDEGELDWLPELSEGIEVWNLLVEMVGSTSLSELQLINSMKMLFRIRFHGDVMVVLGRYLEKMTDTRLAVRSSAFRFGLGVLKMNSELGQYPSIEDYAKFPQFSYALQMGVSETSREFHRKLHLPPQ